MTLALALLAVPLTIAAEIGWDWYKARKRGRRHAG